MQTDFIDMLKNYLTNAKTLAWNQADSADAPDFYCGKHIAYDCVLKFIEDSETRNYQTPQKEYK